MDASKAGACYNVTDVTGTKPSKLFVGQFHRNPNIAPVVSLNGEERVVTKGMYQDAGVTAIDDRDGDLTDKVSFLAVHFSLVLTMG